MINIKTVLVLGAGASKDFGFPTGRELVIKIKKMMNKHAEEYQSQLELYNEYDGVGQFSPKEIEKFAYNFKEADPPSIDTWLEKNPEYIPEGKLVIAMALLDYERKSNLKPESNWYQLLFQRLDSHFEEFQNNELSIITFNYDRSLEHYLFNKFIFTYTGKDEEEYKEKFNQLRIIHVYGSLGRLSWQFDKSEQPIPLVPYGTPRDETETISSAANNIKIIPQKFDVVQKSISDEFNEAQKLIADAQALYFLGFGYHETNMEKLGIENLRRPSKVMGTTFKLDHQRIREVERLSLFNITKHDNLINKRVYEFLYEDVDFNSL